jgi:hypothetical protein
MHLASLVRWHTLSICQAWHKLTATLGWSLGCGSVSLAAPSMFGSLGPNAFYIHAVFNLFAIGIVYCFYPETSCRTLEEVRVFQQNLDNIVQIRLTQRSPFEI